MELESNENKRYDMLKRAASCRVWQGDADTDKVADEPSDDDDLMAKYEDWASNLIDVKMWSSRGVVATCDPHLRIT